MPRIGPRPVRKVLLALLVLAVLLELGALLCFPLLAGTRFSYGRLAADRESIAGGGAAASAPLRGPWPDGEVPADEILLRIRDQVVHPYTGFVFDPAANDAELEAFLGGRRITEYGFVGRPGLFEEPGPDRVVIGITGGSVALFFTVHGTDELATALGESPELAGKEIVFVSLALLGYKQPQQLTALSYALALGAHFDWIVNLDGFNEVALPATENVPKGVAPIFPRSWYWRVAELPDPALERLRAEAFRLGDERRELAERASGSLLCYSVAWNLAWKLRDGALARRLADTEARMAAARTTGETPFVARGPAGAPLEGPELWDHLVGIWERSSLAMHRLCAGSGIRYLHALQPNQYVPDSKPMGEAERRLAVSPTSRFREPAEEGYPRLRAAGQRLAASGVAFYDLTRVFADVPEPLYEDNCCHFVPAGNRILARALAAAMLAELRRP